MRIAFFDGLLETHVPDSLERAFIARGHTVYNTGKIGHGFLFESRPSQLQTIENYIDEVISFAPDFILVFRPASLPPTQLSRLKRSNAILATWMSDDPVLWDLSYRPIVDMYDIVLNCGAERVLSFYDNHFGRSVGLNMPFWTDNVSFPYVYGRQTPESTAMFLGNVQDAVRRRRYYVLGDLDTDIRIHGNTGIDFNFLGAGYLDSDAEVVDAASRAKLAVNIPQFFSDHQGLPTWFDGLSDLGTFQFPSRVIQYAAMGLPIVSVTPTPQDYDTFPELVLVDQYEHIDSAVRDLIRDEDTLHELSLRTHERFAMHFSAQSRVLALESLTDDDSWRALDVGDRARWFAGFDGRGFEPDDSKVSTAQREQIRADALEPRHRRESQGHAAELAVEEPLVIAVVGQPAASAASAISVAERALKRLGHVPSLITRQTTPSVFREDPSREFEAFLDPQELLKQVDADVVMLVGSSYVVSLGGRALLSSKKIPLLVHSVTNRSLNISNSKLASRADGMTVTHPDLLRAFKAGGFNNVDLARPLVDSDFTDLVVSTPAAPKGVKGIAMRRRDLSSQKMLVQDLLELDSSLTFIDEMSEPPLTVEAIYALVASAVVVVGDDTSMPGTQTSELFPFALAAGGLVVTPRSPGIASRGIPGVTHISARDRYELLRKLYRIRGSVEEYSRYVSCAWDHVISDCSAEQFFDSWIKQGFEALSSSAEYCALSRGISSLPPNNSLSSLEQKVRSTPLYGVAVRIHLTYSPPRQHDYLNLVRLNVWAGDQLLGSACMSELIGETEFMVLLPARSKYTSIKVELHSAGRLPFFNWRHWLNVNVDLHQSSLANPVDHLTVLSSNGSFQSSPTTNLA